jgi:hypothetical protein
MSSPNYSIEATGLNRTIADYLRRPGYFDRRLGP